jgi:1,3-beta-glucan synthase
MGEQILSCEHYYLGTQLPIDRFLTFCYGHPGFIINNILVIFAVQVFVLTSMPFPTSDLTLCLFCSGLPWNLELFTQDVPSGQFLAGQAGCYNLVPVFEWIIRCISIFLVFMISFLSLFLQGMVFSPRTFCLLTVVVSRIGQTWDLEGDLASHKTLPFALSHLRSIHITLTRFSTT